MRDKDIAKRSERQGIGRKVVIATRQRYHLRDLCPTARWSLGTARLVMGREFASRAQRCASRNPRLNATG
jgi:hypothetical protein